MWLQYAVWGWCQAVDHVLPVMPSYSPLLYILYSLMCSLWGSSVILTEEWGHSVAWRNGVKWQRNRKRRQQKGEWTATCTYLLKHSSSCPFIISALPFFPFRHSHLTCIVAFHFPLEPLDIGMKAGPWQFSMIVGIYTTDFEGTTVLAMLKSTWNLAIFSPHKLEHFDVGKSVISVVFSSWKC